ncbi:MAG TPA: proline dehydrogenase family protein, partial [Chloroflexota bacterium]|nr:proline dehydrogenase family protein [Chloroflexota bacterium]
MSIGAAVASEAELEAQVEARTQRYGQQLLAQVQYRRAGWRETAEDQLFDLLAGDGRLRTQVLRLVDVMPSLAAGRDDGRLLELAREFLGPVADALPAPLALPLKLGLAGAVPAPWFARLARTAVQQMGRRFIVPSGRRGTWEVLRRLRAEGRMATFDVVGEAVVGERQAAAYVDRYLDMIEALGRDPDAGRDSPGGVRRLQISLKLSALTAHFDPVDPQGTQRRLQEPLERILDAARRAGVAVTWDVEQYAFRDLTWWLFQEQFGPGRPFGTWDGAGLAVQAYLVDSEPFVQQVVAFARRRGVPFQVRLVKGAYWDYETIVAVAAHWPVPVFQEKWQTDAQYERLTHTLLAAWPSLNTALGSHNVRSLAHGAAVADALGLDPEVVEYQTLYGMEPAISGALPAMGWLARDYVPSGDLLGGMAYLVRRLLENTSQVGFLRQSRADLDPEALLAPPAGRSSQPPASGPPVPCSE